MDNMKHRAMPQRLQHLLEESAQGTGDSDRHLLTLFSIAAASRGKLFIELGVRGGQTTLPLLMAAEANGGKLISVDRESTDFQCPEDLRDHWEFVHSDALEFLAAWDFSRQVDLIYVDDWHAYDHVRQELQHIDRMVGPSGVVLLHDLMYGYTDPHYHTDLTLPEGQWAEGGPYRAVAELPLQFWEWSTLPWGNGLTLLRKKYSSKYHIR